MQMPGVERVGDCKGTANHYHVSGGTGDPFIMYEWPAGGTGGIAGMDGNNAVRTYLEGDFNSIQSTEVIEAGLPVRIESLAIREGSCGDGRDRGGFGLRRAVRLLAPQGSLSVLSERNRPQPPTAWTAVAHRGPTGSPCSVGDAVLAPSPIPGKVSGFALQRDDVVIVETSGGGGCGDPLTRDPARVAGDVGQGTLTVDAGCGALRRRPRGRRRGRRTRRGHCAESHRPGIACSSVLRFVPEDIAGGHAPAAAHQSPPRRPRRDWRPAIRPNWCRCRARPCACGSQCDPAMEDRVALLGPSARAMLADAGAVMAAAAWPGYA